MRPIDADELNKKNMYGNANPIVYRTYAENLIKSAPTIDAVEVVRCRDCGKSRETEDEEFCFCMQFADTVHADAFCSYGERREV